MHGGTRHTWAVAHPPPRTLHGRTKRHMFRNVAALASGALWNKWDTLCARRCRTMGPWWHHRRFYSRTGVVATPRSLRTGSGPAARAAASNSRRGKACHMHHRGRRSSPWHLRTSCTRHTWVDSSGGTIDASVVHRHRCLPLGRHDRPRVGSTHSRP